MRNTLAFLAVVLVCASTTASAQSVVTESLDAKMGRIGQMVPSFGGLFYNDDGLLTVFLSDARDKASVERAIADVLGSEIVPTGGVDVRAGQFGFGDLQYWFPMTVELLSNRYVVMADIDEANNRLLVGVEDDATLEWVQTQLSRYRIPAGMVELRIVEPVRVNTLRDAVSPRIGGYEIGIPGGGSCTLGFNATRNGVRGFVTNSHCTSQRGVVNGDDIRQDNNGPVVGDEEADPPFFSGFFSGCPADRVCRKSDAAFIDYRSTATSTRGVIRRPNAVGSLNDSDGLEFRITSERFFPIFSGDPINKVGRTTGWTQGNVTNTCFSVNVSNSNITMQCQFRGSYASDAGDSGSPVFRRPNAVPGNNDVELYGIHWGSSGTFSAIGEILGELGGMDTCISGSGC